MQTHRFALQERRVWIFVKGSQSHSQRWYVLCSCFNRVGVWTRAPTGSGCLSSGCAREKAMLESAERSEGILHYVACQFRLSMRLRVSLSHSSLSLPHAHTTFVWLCLGCRPLPVPHMTSCRNEKEKLPIPRSYQESYRRNNHIKRNGRNCGSLIVNKNQMKFELSLGILRSKRWRSAAAVGSD